MTKSLQERLANAEALVAKYKQQIAAEAILNNIQPGDAVSFKYGRGETQTVKEGTVISTGDSPRGKLAVIQTGTGLEISTVKVRVADITENATADARTGTTEEAPAAEEAPVEAVTTTEAPSAEDVPPRPPFAQDDPLNAK